MKKSPPLSLKDLREPNIGRVHQGSYLITGLPRIRSAWLSALLSHDDFYCYHEAPTTAMPPINPGFPFGLCDPGAACLYPRTALNLFGAHKVVIIDRSARDSRRALEKFAGAPATNWQALEERDEFFCSRVEDAYFVSFKDLSKFSVVDALHRHVIGRPLNRQRFDLFDGLRIEQDVVKRAKAEAA
jgi:hypothetical protein